MTRQMMRTGILSAIALGLILAVPAGFAGSEAVGPAKIRVTDLQVSYIRVDLGKGGRTPGDMEIVRNLLYNQRITNRSIGHVELVCTFVVGNSRSCRGTYFLPRGKLVVGGSMLYRQFYELAILGGTGLYDNARGTLTVTQTNREPVRNVVLFRLVG